MEAENIIKFFKKSNFRLKEGLDNFLDVFTKKNDDLYSKIEDKLTEEERLLFKENNKENRRQLQMFIEEYEEFNLDNIKSFHNAQLMLQHKIFSKSFDKTQKECMDKVNEIEFSDLKIDNKTLENSDAESNVSISYNEEEFTNLLTESDMFSMLQENNDSDMEDSLKRMESFRNVFDSSIDDVSETTLNYSPYDEDNKDLNLQKRLELELMNFIEIKDIAKEKSIVLSKNSKKKNKSELINEILEN